MTGPRTARLRIDEEATVADVPRRLFGSFVEHMGRCVYTGVFEPDHPTADEEGFRGDVLELVRELGVTVVRYPGGNFVSGYRWEDGVGPRAARPRRLDTAWHEIDPNTFGLHEFASWAAKAGVEVMEAVNLGTRGIADAMRLVEYANHPGDTQLSEWRRENGADEPFGIRLWCLGNEMDGPWQLGAKTAEEYGRLAHETAKGMRGVDRDIELVVAGSSGPDMPTFGEWERTVLRHTYADVDYVSLHLYVQERPGEAETFLRSADRLDAFIGDVVAIVDEVRAEGGHEKVVHLSLDEWNVWDQDAFNDPAEQARMLSAPWSEHPRVIEDEYTVTDAVVVGTLIHTLLRRSDRVKIANQAQLANVIAPIMTEPGGPAWRQTIFWPFARIAHWARGAVVRVDVADDDVDAVATVDGDGGALFVANRSLTEAVTVELALASVAGDLRRVVEAELLAPPAGDRTATNSRTEPDRVRMTPLDLAEGEGVVSFTLPPVSWACLRLAR